MGNDKVTGFPLQSQRLYISLRALPSPTFGFPFALRAQPHPCRVIVQVLPQQTRGLWDAVIATRGTFLNVSALKEREQSADC